ncbi:Multisubstrate pseudouridine synthase 7 [Lecanosticta acicola]|uniref:Multisubstrate pseudouridine synthase 7 n=1 Tax=Lecanosticta acicola TaxID=111012 RepID=A0AAI8YTN0_9PEZI|nr:Multisubstrate pseudouridine synthase 7 [Lecanosticta acicola]
MAAPSSATNNAPDGDGVRRQDGQERAVGIAAFVRPDAPGFSCTVKHRYTDFLVNEILPGGQVLHLTGISGNEEGKRKRDADKDASRKKLKSEGQGQLAPNKALSVEGTTEAAPNAAASVTSPESSTAEAAEASIKAMKAAAIASISDADKSVLKDVFGEQGTSELLNLYAAVVAHPDRKPRDHHTVRSQPIAEKSKRTEAHVCIRRIFNSRLETLTVQDQDHQSGPGTIISIKAALPRSAVNQTGDKSNREGQRGKVDWAELGGEYIHFSLYKENKDTMEVLSFLGSQLKLHPKHFSFAGTKDRRAVTVQRVAVHRMKRERMESLNRMARGWRLGGPWEYKTTPLELGMLTGNEFLLTLRNARFDGEDTTWSMEKKLEHARRVAEKAAQSLSSSGYLNYFGLQRFGSYQNGTHVVGMKMLKGDLKGACDAIMAYDESLLDHAGKDVETSDLENRSKIPQEDVWRASGIHEFHKSGNSKHALDQIPKRFNAERGIITHLGKRDRKTGARPNQTDYQGALMQIQQNLRSMYVHAYQSFVWNTVASKRQEIFGEKVVEGDLVVVGEKEREEGTSTTGGALKEEVDEDGEPIVLPSATGENPGGASGLVGDPSDPYLRARPLTKAEAESGRFQLFDVVLPLPGFDVVYPSNELGKYYEDFMASEEGGALDPHNMRRAWRDVSLPGGYRKVMSRPLKDVEVEVKAYAGGEEQMVQTDLERLKKGDETDAVDERQETNGGTAAKDKIAVILKLQLGSSQYATMAVRELTKGGGVPYTPDFSLARR